MSVVARRRQLRQEAAERQKVVVRELKAAVKTARSKKRQHLAKIQRKCVRERERIQREAFNARAQLRERIQKAKEAARTACKACKVSARENDLAEIDRALAAVETERAAILDMRQRAARMRDQRGRSGGIRRQEQLRESDDQVRNNLEDPWHIEVWERVKHQIRESPYASRTEVFLQYLHDHPEAVWEVQQSAEARWLRDAEEEEAKLEREWRNSRQLAKMSDHELEELGHDLERAANRLELDTRRAERSTAFASGVQMLRTAVPF